MKYYIMWKQHQNSLNIQCSKDLSTVKNTIGSDKSLDQYHVNHTLFLSGLQIHSFSLINYFKYLNCKA